MTEPEKKRRRNIGKLLPFTPDAAAGKSAREEAIERVERGAPDDWKVDAFRAIVELTFRVDTFTTDDVWNELGADTIREPRAMGAIIRSVASSGHIEPTDEFRISNDPACHRRPKRVWRSLNRRRKP